MQITENRSAREMEQAARKRDLRFSVIALLLACLLGGAYVAFHLDNILLPAVVLILVFLPLLLWKFPRLGLYLIYCGVCLFEILPTPYPDSLTDRIPFFWNVNTIFQVYTGANVKAIPLNLFEVLVLVIGVMSAIRNIYMRSINLRGGVLLIPILIYVGFVSLGWMNGLATGGDFKESLQEVRAQFYFLLAYLMGFNMIQEKKQLNAFFWITTLTLGLKGILYTLRYIRFVKIPGLPIPDQGVGSHEEAMFFDAFVVQLVILALCGLLPRMQKLMWLLLPLVIQGNLATNRRAATAAMVIIVPFLLATAYRCLPRQRKVAAVLMVLVATLGPIYYQLYKNSPSIIAQPARAIRSQFQPDERDANSDAYRNAENSCIMATIKQNPATILIGYGYGKRMLHAVQIADISGFYPWWDLLPHNQILWVWMRVGSLGFFAFWMMICAAIIHLCRIVRDCEDTYAKAIGLQAMICVGMLIVFGLVDLMMSNMRGVLFVACWVGVAMGYGERQLALQRAGAAA